MYPSLTQTLGKAFAWSHCCNRYILRVLLGRGAYNTFHVCTQALWLVSARLLTAGLLRFAGKDFSDTVLCAAAQICVGIIGHDHNSRFCTKWPKGELLFACSSHIRGALFIGTSNTITRAHHHCHHQHHYHHHYQYYKDRERESHSHQKKQSVWV